MKVHKTLEYDFAKKKEVLATKVEIINHLTLFVYRLWQTHIFGKVTQLQLPFSL